MNMMFGLFAPVVVGVASRSSVSSATADAPAINASKKERVHLVICASDRK